MKDIYSLHKREYGTEPEVVVSTPAKINLMGEHTEHVEGYILSLTVNRRLHLAVSRRNDKQIYFFSQNYNERKKSTVTGLKYKKDDRWANYLKGVIATLMQSGSPIGGVNVTVFSEIPQGIGMSSSTSLTMALTLALKKLYDLDLTGIQLVELARQSEQRYADRIGPSVISSPFVVYYSRANTAMFLDIEKLKPEYIPFSFPQVKLVITNSNVPMLLTNAEIAHFHADWKKSFELFRKKKKSSLNRMDTMDLFDLGDEISEQSKRCLQHLVEENRRVMDMKNALHRKDLLKAGKLMSRAHESARDLMEISCPELDWLVKRALETEGVFGSRMIGDGFGGCTITLMDISYLDEYEKRLEEYEHIFGFKADYFVCETDDGIEPL